jgi:predicted alpha/beta hydrolase family esterase
MVNAIIVHGRLDQEEYYSNTYPSPSNSWFIPWLQKQLLLKDILTQTPEMPTPFRPEYSEWKKTIEQFDVNSGTILIGHSWGAGFLLKWLAETKTKVWKLVLVAPWLDLENTTRLLNFTLDPKLSDTVHNIHILVSEDDFEENVQETTKLLIDTYKNMHIHRFQNKGHFTGIENMETPELLQICLD